jgi:hypothetical protein
VTCVSYIKKNIKRKEQILWRPNNSLLVDRKVMKSLQVLKKKKKKKRKEVFLFPLGAQKKFRRRKSI